MSQTLREAQGDCPANKKRYLRECVTKMNMNKNFKKESNKLPTQYVPTQQPYEPKSKKHKWVGKNIIANNNTSQINSQLSNQINNTLHFASGILNTYYMILIKYY